MNQIILKKSSVGGKTPLPANLEYGEVALNYNDGKLYYKNSNNVIDNFSANTSKVESTSTNTSYPLLFSLPNNGESQLYYNNLASFNPSTNVASIDISGVAAEATKLETARRITLNGQLTGFADFDGTQNITISATIKPNIELQTGSLLIEDAYQIDTTTSSSAQLTQYEVDSFSTSTYRTAKYLAQVSGGSHFHSTEILLVHNDDTAFLTEYGTVYTSQDPLGIFDAIIANGMVKLMFTPSVANTSIRVIRHTIKVS